MVSVTLIPESGGGAHGAKLRRRRVAPLGKKAREGPLSLIRGRERMDSFSEGIFNVRTEGRVEV